MGNSDSYFRATTDLNREVFEKVSRKSYRPMLSLLLDLCRRQPKFRFALSVSGVFLEQALEYDKRVIELIDELVKTGQVELLAETYYHSLAALYSQAEFGEQVLAHQKLLSELFNYRPRVFRNTELIYSNEIGRVVSQMGYAGMLTEAVERYLGGRERTQVFVDLTGQLPLLLKHAPLSDDIAFRFSDRNWPAYPLHADHYLKWLSDYGDDDLLNLFMDFETFGEHQWADTGIFDFFSHLIDGFLASDWNETVTPSMVLSRGHFALAKRRASLPRYDVPSPISWADVDRDITAWVDNPLQQDSLRLIYSLEKAVKASQSQKILHSWRLLQTSDHFYYMCTKWSADGDVHAYFSPYEDPFEAYRRFSIVMADFESRLW